MIRLIDYGIEVGINISNEFKWYPKTDITVSSDKDAKVSLFDKGELKNQGTFEELIKESDDFRESVKSL